MKLRIKPIQHIRGDIGLGDLAKILVELDLKSSKHLNSATRVLGFEGIAYPYKGRADVAANLEQRRPRKLRGKQQKSKPRFSLPPTPEVSESPAGDIINSTLTSLPIVRPESTPPDWLHTPEQESDSKIRVSRKQLFTHNHSAGILKASLVVRRPGKRLDFPKIIRHVVEDKALRELPYLPIGGVENGVDLLCDYSESMQPFYADLNDLHTSLHDIFGKNRYRFFEYDTNPGESISWSNRDKATEWRPVPGRPVLLATDFGNARTGPHRRLQLRDWRNFIKHVNVGKTPLLVLTPLPPANLPNWLGRETKIIHWDPRTRASSVSRIIGIGHQIGK